jgi:cytochrome P450
MVNSTVDASSERPIFDPSNPHWTRDPFPMYAELRQRAPIHRNDMGFWVLTRHADCLAVLRDRRASSDSMNLDQGGAPQQIRGRISEEKPEEAGFVALRPFVFRDPPDHTRLRSLVSTAFTPRFVASLRAAIQGVVDELLDACLEKGEVDLLSEFAYPLPVRVICDLLGVPIEDQDRFKVWAEALARGLDPDFLLTPEVIEARANAALQFARYFFELVADRRKSPGTDLVSRLLEVEDDGTVLSETELLSSSILLLVAGHETTVNLISGGLLALLQHPDQLERFREDPGVRRTAIEEMLRYVSPVQLTQRTFTEECEFGGVEFGPGDFAMLLIASANRDPAEFENPNAVDFRRQGNRHLTFAAGPHRCIGSHLARRELKIAIEEWLARIPDFAIKPDAVMPAHAGAVWGIENLPLYWPPK